MGEKVKNLLKERGFEYAIYFILLLIVGNSVLMLIYRQTIKENTTQQNDVLEIRTRVGEMDRIINRADMGLRGYVLITEPSLIDPTLQSFEVYKQNNEEIRNLLQRNGYDISKLNRGMKAYEDYMVLLQQLVDLVNNGNTDEVVEVIKSDPGQVAWQNYGPMQADVLNFADGLEQTASKEYANLLRNTRLSQLILLIISIPFLLAIINRLRKNRINRRKLFNRLDENQKRFLFDPNSEENHKTNDEEEVINEIVSNLKKASQFINKITEGNYEAEWEGLTDENLSSNEHGLSGALIKMKEQMVKVKNENDIRLWMTEGLSKFGEIIRNHQNDMGELSDLLISELVKYLKAKQGGIFILNDENEHNKFLQLTGCYAYDRKKYMDKKIKLNDGLIGQCFMEKEHIYLKNIPQDYVRITSGLGETNPNSLVLIPLKSDEQVIGVMELASLNEFKPQEIDFLNQLGETIASAISGVKVNQSTKELLMRSQQQSEELHAQEEEMRQNMEELEATQEEMTRKEREVTRLLEESMKKEEELKSRFEEAEKMQELLELENAMFTHLMNLLPDRVTIKDAFGTYLRVNKTKFDSLKEIGFTEVEGKSDKDFFGEEHFKNSYELEKNLMDSDQEKIDKESKLKLPDGNEIWATTTWSKFKNKNGEILGTIVMTRNITEIKNCYEKIEKLKVELADLRNSKG